MGALPLTLELLLVFVVTCYLSFKYGNWKTQHVIVTVSTLIAWYFSFIIAFILPLDVALAFYRQCMLPTRNSSDVENETTSLINETAAQIVCEEPKSYVPDYVLPDLWRFVYWSTEVLTWLVLPIMQGYCNAGDFGPLPKLKTSLRDNAIYYGTFLLLFGVLLIYVAAKGFSLNPENLKVVCITASNTWGLFLLVLLLGYGLVEVPRKIWQAGIRGHSLNKLYFEIEKLAAEKSDAEDALRTAFEDTRNVMESLKDNHPFSSYARIIMTKFPESIVQQFTRRETSGRNTRYRDTDVANLPDEKGLARLHKRVIDALNGYSRVEAQWIDWLDSALHMEDVFRNDVNTNRQFVRTTHDSRPQYLKRLCSPTIEWYWECMLKRPLLKLLGVLLALISLCVVWSEVTFFSRQPVLSLAALIVFGSSQHNDYAFIELFSILVIAYLCMCAYYTVFKVKIYRYYHLDPHHHTSENSLIFAATLLSRLTPPLCLNFLGLIHLDSHVVAEGNVETAFTKIMGHMDVVNIIAKGFNIYFPMAICVLCLGTYFRLGTKFLHFIGIDQFMEEDNLTVEMVQGGKALVQTERNRLVRAMDRDARNEFWKEKLADHDINRPLRRSNQPGGEASSATSSGRAASTPTAAGANTFVPVDFSDKAGIVSNSAGAPQSDYWGDFGTSSSDRIDSFGAQEGFGRVYGSTIAQPRKDIFDDL